jgi:hypothetical protein
LTSNLSIGVDANYNFGRIETRNVQKIPEVQFGTQELNTSDLS